MLVWEDTAEEDRTTARKVIGLGVISLPFKKDSERLSNDRKMNGPRRNFIAS